MRRGFVSSVAAMLACTGLALAQAPVPSEAPAPPAAPLVSPNSPVVGGGATPYSPLAPNGITPAPFGLSAGGPGELMTCPGGTCGGDCGNIFQESYKGTQAFWLNAEYLLWRTKTADIPSLNFTQPLGTVTITQITQVNGGPAINVNQTLPVLMQASSTNPGLSWKDQPGIRFYGGFWFDKDQTLGLDAGFFILWRRTEQFANIPNPSPTGAPFQLLIPTGFTDQFVSSSGTINAATVSVPINLLASVSSKSISNFSSELWGTQLNLRSRKCYFGCTTIDCIAGARYLNLGESINSFQALSLTNISGASNIPGQTPPIAGFNFIGNINDSISTRNNFYGAQVGFAYDWMIGHGLFLAGWTKLAIGDNHEDIDLHGFTSAFNATQTGVVTNAGGNLVGPADNNTHRTFDRIAAVPELAMNLGYQPCAWCRFYAGYTFLYISSVARPGDQTVFVPTTANVTIGQTTQTGNILAPTFQVHDTSFWAQGVNFGVEFRY